MTAFNLQAELEKIGANHAPWLGFGTAHLGVGGERENAAQLLNEAFEQGIRYFDTARLYGDGESEFAIGETFASKRQQIILTSKAGIIPWTERKALRLQNKVRRLIGLQPLPVEHVFGAFNLAQLKASFDKSLRALRTDYLDILLLHECAVEQTQNDDILAWADALKQAGKIRAFGSAATLAETDRILTARPRGLDVVQHAHDALTPLPEIPIDMPCQRITHSALSHVLPAVNARLAQGDDLATRFETEFGIDLRTPAQWIPKLLQHNHVVTGGAPVLFSTTRPGRIAATLKGLEGGSATDAELLQTLQSELVSIAPE